MINYFGIWYQYGVTNGTFTGYTNVTFNNCFIDQATYDTAIFGNWYIECSDTNNIPGGGNGDYQISVLPYCSFTFTNCVFYTWWDAMGFFGNCSASFQNCLGQRFFNYPEVDPTAYFFGNAMSTFVVNNMTIYQGEDVTNLVPFIVGQSGFVDASEPGGGEAVSTNIFLLNNVVWNPDTNLFSGGVVQPASPIDGGLQLSDGPGFVITNGVAFELPNVPPPYVQGIAPLFPVYTPAYRGNLSGNGGGITNIQATALALTNGVANGSLLEYTNGVLQWVQPNNNIIP